MALSFDSRQRQAIRARSNTVVTAGAGSGKTAVICERYCRLLETEAIGVERILALTFTQKAASEMYQRIYGRIRRIPKLRPHLQNFQQAQIATLDSFSAEILRASSDAFGIPEEFRHDEAAAARLGERLAMEFLLEKLDIPAMRELLRIHGFETLWKDLFGDLARRHLHLPAAADFKGMARIQLGSCRQDLHDGLRAAGGCVGELRQLEARTASIRQAQEALAGFDDLESDLHCGRFGRAVAALGALQLKKPGGRGAEDIQRLRQLIDRLRPLLRRLTLLAATLERQALFEEVFSLLEEFSERFLEQKRASGCVTFQDVAQLAVQALIRDKALRQFYKTRYRYIMIDEFQDNNQLQRDLLFLLSEKLELSCDGVPSAADLQADKLFFVGDEKQSIYRFRGADVSVFKSLQTQLEAGGGTSVVLDRNYRSERGLIEMVNTVFSRVMAEAAAEYEARYQPMKSGGQETEAAAQIHLLYGDQPSAAAPEFAPSALAEAHAVARCIRDWVGAGTLSLPADHGTRPADYQDFAVLLRSTGNQVHYERMFRHFQIPYSTDNIRSLFIEAPINDLYLMLQLAVYPEDRAAYAGLLRSPFVNLSDETMIAVLMEESEPFAGLRETELRDAELRRWQQGAEIYAAVRQAADRIPIAELVQRLWYRHGYRYAILRDPHNHNFLEHIRYMMRLAERADAQGDSLALFLDFLRPNLGRYERLEDLQVLRSRQPGVQLLTIHRSKGLEFPVVVLADMGNVGRPRRDRGRPYYVSSRYGITVNLGAENYFSEIGEQAAEREELAEVKRLLYVAMTRAQNHLVLAGTHKQRNRSTQRAHLNLLLEGLGWAAEVPEDGSIPQRDFDVRIRRIAPLGWTALENRKAQPDMDAAARLDALYKAQPARRSAVRREISVSELCTRLDPLLEQRRARLKLDTKERLLPPVDADAVLQEQGLQQRFGILTHRLLALYDGEAGSVSRQVDQTGLPLPHRQSILQSALTLCRSFFDSRLGRLLAASGRQFREFPFLYRYHDERGPLYISGQIDLAFEAEGCLYLIDFKTDSRYRPGEHEGQLALYTRAVQEQTDGEVRPYLFLLRSAEAIPSDPAIDLHQLIAEIRGQL